MTPIVSDVRRAAQVYFKLKLDIRTEARHRAIAWPRQMAMTVAREVTAASLPMIAAHFGGRDHTTVIAAVNRTFERTRDDEDAALDYTLVARLSQDFAVRRRARETEWVRQAMESGQIIAAPAMLEVAE